MTRSTKSRSSTTTRKPLKTSTRERQLILKKTTETYNHRVFNNWIKSVLISKYAKAVKDNYKAEWGSDDDDDDKDRGRSNGLEQLSTYPRLSVLDVGCGKGGDFNKWKFAGTRNYVGVDISLKAVQDAAQRKMDSKLG